MDDWETLADEDKTIVSTAETNQATEIDAGKPKNVVTSQPKNPEKEAKKKKAQDLDKKWE